MAAERSEKPVPRSLVAGEAEVLMNYGMSAIATKPPTAHFPGSGCAHRANSVCSGGGNGGAAIQEPRKEEGMGKFVFLINDDIGRRGGALWSLARNPSVGSSGGVGERGEVQLPSCLLYYTCRRYPNLHLSTSEVY